MAILGPRQPRCSASRERIGLSIDVVRRPRSDDVLAWRTDLFVRRGPPAYLRCDNGPEFAGRLLDQWAYCNDVGLEFSRPATPTDNAFIESFNARLRQEGLNASWFLSVPDTRARVAVWRRESNEDRPHSALGNLTPQEFVDHARAAPEVV